MDLHHPHSRTVAVAEAVTLVAFVASVVSPSSLGVAAATVMSLGALAAIVSALQWSWSRGGSVPLAAVVVGSAGGLLGSLAYLRSIADEPSAIPLGGVGVLLLSLVGLTVSAAVLAVRRGDARPVASRPSVPQP